MATSLAARRLLAGWFARAAARCLSRRGGPLGRMRPRLGSGALPFCLPRGFFPLGFDRLRRFRRGVTPLTNGLAMRRPLRGRLALGSWLPLRLPGFQGLTLGLDLPLQGGGLLGLALADRGKV